MYSLGERMIVVTSEKSEMDTRSPLALPYPISKIKNLSKFPKSEKT